MADESAESPNPKVRWSPAKLIASVINARKQRRPDDSDVVRFPGVTFDIPKILIKYMEKSAHGHITLCLLKMISVSNAEKMDSMNQEISRLSAKLDDQATNLDKLFNRTQDCEDRLGKIMDALSSAIENVMANNDVDAKLTDSTTSVTAFNQGTIRQQLNNLNESIKDIKKEMRDMENPGRLSEDQREERRKERQPSGDGNEEENGSKLFQSENRNPEVKKKPKSQEDDEDSISAAAAARAAPAAASASAPFLAPAAASSIFNGSFSASASFSAASATHSHPASSSPETSSTSSSTAFVGRSLSSDVLLSTATGSRRGSSSWPRFDDDDETSDRDADEAALMLGGAVGGEILPADFEMERFGCGGGGDEDDDDEVASVASTALAVVDGGAEGSGGAGSRGGGGGAASDSQRLKSAKVFPSFLRYYSRHYQEMKEAETEVEEEEKEEEEEGKKVKGRRKKKGSKKKRQKGNLSGS